jgi:hypothetical protein
MNIKIMTETEYKNSWVFQTTGMINRYVEGIYPGTQPIRVTNPIMIYLFQRTNPEFFNEILSGNSSGDKLDIIFGEEPIKKDDESYRTPRLNLKSKKIELHETFLSYVWCITYSIFVTHCETVDYPTINKRVGYLKYPITKVNIDSANALFDYAKYIIVDFIPWDKNKLPNPEFYSSENLNKHYVQQTDCFYTSAISFMLCHEYTHAKKHADKIDYNTTIAKRLDYEKEADADAVDMMMKGIDPINQLAVENGIIFALLSMFFFRSSTKGIKHPDNEDRLVAAIEKLDLHDNPYAWEISCVGLRMWDEQWKLNLNWRDEIDSYKHLFYDIINQIKERTNVGTHSS